MQIYTSIHEVCTILILIILKKQRKADAAGTLRVLGRTAPVPIPEYLRK